MFVGLFVIFGKLIFEVITWNVVMQSSVAISLFLFLITGLYPSSSVIIFSFVWLAIFYTLRLSHTVNELTSCQQLWWRTLSLICSRLSTMFYGGHSALLPSGFTSSSLSQSVCFLTQSVRITLLNIMFLKSPRKPIASFRSVANVLWWIFCPRSRIYQ